MSAEAEPSSSGYVPGDVDDYLSGGGAKEKQNAVMTLIAHYALTCLSQLLMGILFVVHAYFSRSMDRGEEDNGWQPSDENGRLFSLVITDSSTGSIELILSACEVEIAECESLLDGRFYLEIESRRRFRIIRSWDQDGYRVAEIEWVQTYPP